ncbi:MAG: hopanoid-associated sugar epimerase [Dehalococcoidia bacterium]
MPLALVTGGTGFIGANVVRALLEEGVAVRALVRRSSDDRNLAGLDVEQIEGDITDTASLDAAVQGVDVVFHVAALYELAATDRPRVFQVNVQGTRAVMNAALRAGVDRVVHTSSVAAVGHIRADGSLASEADWTNPGNFAGPYEESKYYSERLVHDMVERDGLPAVVVNPTAPLGPLDVKPTPTGRMIADAANRAMPGYLPSGGLNIVHVRDVARGHVLAWRRGRVGERYILGHQQGNLTLREIFLDAAEAAADVSAVTDGRGGRWRWAAPRMPLLPLPYAVALAYAHLDERVLSRIWRRPPRAPIAGVRLARQRMWFDCRKAVEELELPQTPVPEAFRDAVEWFRSEGLVG